MTHRDGLVEDAKVDMTPMIDVVFLLIVFFLCIDFRTLEAKLAAYLPKDCGGRWMEDPVPQLSIRIVVDELGAQQPRRAGDPVVDAEGRRRPYLLVGHRVHWMIGARRHDGLAELGEDLAAIARDPLRMVPDRNHPGRKRPMTVVIEPQVGATYHDVANTVDAVNAAGFAEINFGAGRGPSRR